MAVIKTDALVLRNIPFQETSSIVRLYTRDSGKVSVIAKGARRLKSPFRGYLEPLSFIEVIFYYKPTREIQTLSKVEFARAFFREWADASDIAFAMAILECLDRFIRVYEKDEKIFQLSIDMLKFMDANRDLMQEAFVSFLLSFISIVGYKLNLIECSLCKSSLTEAVYESSTGRLICTNCEPMYIVKELLGREVLEYLRVLEETAPVSSLHKLPSTKLGTSIIEFLVSYISFHLDFPVKLRTLKILGDM